MFLFQVKLILQMLTSPCDSVLFVLRFVKHPVSEKAFKINVLDFDDICIYMLSKCIIFLTNEPSF
jgi:hypothetical protein